MRLPMVILLLALAAGQATAQRADVRSPVQEPAAARSGGRAFLLSLAVPGLGHRYASDGRWGTAGSLFLAADAALWTSLLGVRWRRSNLIHTYEALATDRAGADMTGKDRTFALRLASYRSSDEFTEVSLRNRAWDDLAYVDDPSFHWAWASEEDYLRFRDLRNDAETLSRRTTLIVASLVANRLVSGFLAARSARSVPVLVAVRPDASGRRAVVDLAVRF